MQVLRHDKPIGIVKKQAHLSDVPEYIVPDALKRLAGITTHRKNKRPHPNESKSKSIFASRQTNPLLVANLDYAKKKRR